MNVRFNEEIRIHLLVKWSYAYRAARRGDWQKYASDRERFKFKINNYYAPIITPVLEYKIKYMQCNRSIE